HQEHDHVRLTDGGLHLPTDRGLHRLVALGLEPSRVDQEEAAARPLRASEVAIARDTGLVLDDCASLTEHPVDKRRLADIVAADDRDRRKSVPHRGYMDSVSSCPATMRAGESALTTSCQATSSTNTRSSVSVPAGSSTPSNSPAARTTSRVSAPG